MSWPFSSRWARLALYGLSGLIVLAGAVQYQHSLEQEAIALASQIQDTMTIQLTSRAWTLQRMAQQWSHEGRPSQHAWRATVAAYLEGQVGYDALGWIDATQVLRWHTGPAASSLAPLPEFLAIDRAHGKVVASRGVRLEAGRVLLAAPVGTQEAFDGWLVGLLHLAPLLEKWLAPVLPHGYGVTILMGEDVVYRIPSSGVFPAVVQQPSRPFDIAGAAWRVEVHPPVGLHPFWAIAAVDLWHSVGLCLALLLSWRLYRLYRQRVTATPPLSPFALAAETPLSPLLTQPPLALAEPGTALYCIDRQGLLTYVSPLAAVMLGWRPEEVLGKPQHVLLHHTLPNGRVYPRDACPIDLALRDGIPYQVSHDLFWRRNGTRFPATYTCTPVRDAEAVVIGLLVVFQRLVETPPPAPEMPTETADAS